MKEREVAQKKKERERDVKRERWMEGGREIEIEGDEDTG